MFEKFVETLNNTSKAVTEKTKQSTEIVKTNLKINTEEKELEALYCEIGKLFYDKSKDDPCCDTMKELFDKVTEKKKALEAYHSQVRILKGINICQSCGVEISADCDFCGKCGAKITKPEPIEENTDEAAEEPIIIEVDGEDNSDAAEE